MFPGSKNGNGNCKKDRSCRCGCRFWKCFVKCLMAWFAVSDSFEDEYVPRNCTRSPLASPKHRKQMGLHRQM